MKKSFILSAALFSAAAISLPSLSLAGGAQTFPQAPLFTVSMDPSAENYFGNITWNFNESSPGHYSGIGMSLPKFQISRANEIFLNNIAQLTDALL